MASALSIAAELSAAQAQATSLLADSVQAWGEYVVARVAPVNGDKAAHVEAHKAAYVKASNLTSNAVQVERDVERLTKALAKAQEAEAVKAATTTAPAKSTQKATTKAPAKSTRSKAVA